jgi:septal ring factor EnvC (AmiA/AmiB activator)
VNSTPPDKRTIRTSKRIRKKLTQAAHRIEKLEQQVAIQRQRLGQYYQQLYPSSLAEAEERLLALGAAVNYKRLLKYNELTLILAVARKLGAILRKPPIMTRWH